MIRKKHGLRIATFVPILLLILLPLLSSPVAATVTFDTWAITNINIGGTPDAMVGKTTVSTNFITGSNWEVINVTCNISGTDQSGNEESPSSRHCVKLDVQQIDPEILPNQSAYYEIYLDDSQDYGPLDIWVCDVYEIEDEIKLSVTVEAYCINLDTEEEDYQEEYWEITITKI